MLYAIIDVINGHMPRLNMSEAGCVGWIFTGILFCLWLEWAGQQWVAPQVCKIDVIGSYRKRNRENLIMQKGEESNTMKAQSSNALWDSRICSFIIYAYFCMNSLLANIRSCKLSWVFQSPWGLSVPTHWLLHVSKHTFKISGDESLPVLVSVSSSNV